MWASPGTLVLGPSKFQGGPVAKPQQGQAELCPELSWAYILCKSNFIMLFFSQLKSYIYNPYFSNCPKVYLLSYFAFSIYLVSSSSFSFFP